MGGIFLAEKAFESNSPNIFNKQVTRAKLNLIFVCWYISVSFAAFDLLAQVLCKRSCHLNALHKYYSSPMMVGRFGVDNS